MFRQFGLDPLLLKNVAEQGYTEPTPVQVSAIPPAMDGHDLVTTAETGSGKTAAFLLPIIQRLLTVPRGVTSALILCPTREIALQTLGEAKKLGRGTGLRSTAIYGGVGFEPQIQDLRSGSDIVVATPGRLLDHVGRGNINFRSLRTLVLDEADRMLDMGFLPDLRRILALLPKDRQTLLYSATMPAEIEALAGRFMRRPVRVSIGRPSTPPSTINQAVFAVEQDEKTGVLLSLIQKERMYSVLVFTRTKHRADRLARQLARAGLPAACIHGDRSQHQREAALDGFRRGTHQVLVATDIAARGLDIPGVSHVVNYDLPPVPEDYIHRIGRTARAGADGTAFSLVTKDDGETLRDIEYTLGREIPLLDPPAAASLPVTATPHRRGTPVHRLDTPRVQRAEQAKSGQGEDQSHRRHRSRSRGRHRDTARPVDQPHALSKEPPVLAQAERSVPSNRDTQGHTRRQRVITITVAN